MSLKINGLISFKSVYIFLVSRIVQSMVPILNSFCMFI